METDIQYNTDEAIRASSRSDSISRASILAQNTARNVVDEVKKEVASTIGALYVQTEENAIQAFVKKSHLEFEAYQNDIYSELKTQLLASLVHELLQK